MIRVSPFSLIFISDTLSVKTPTFEFAGTVTEEGTLYDAGSNDDSSDTFIGKVLSELKICVVYTSISLEEVPSNSTPKLYEES